MTEKDLRKLARTHALEALDQWREFSSLAEACAAYWLNLGQTLTEQGETLTFADYGVLGKEFSAVLEDHGVGWSPW